MKTETPETPSELAMKAAVKIIRMFNDGTELQTSSSISKIIDRETNLPALLKQRDALREALSNLIPAIEEQHVVNFKVSLIRDAYAALALCDKVEDAPQAISMHLWLKEGGHNLVVETTMDKDGKIHPTVKK